MLGLRLPNAGPDPPVPAVLEPSMRISMDEWNVWYAWYRPSSVTDGIYAALALHMLMEEAEKSGIALACHFQAVNEGMLCVKPDHVSLTAQGQVFSWMNRWHMGNRLCSASQEPLSPRTVRAGCPPPWSTPRSPRKTGGLLLLWALQRGGAFLQRHCAAALLVHPGKCFGRGCGWHFPDAAPQCAVFAVPQHELSKKSRKCRIEFCFFTNKIDQEINFVGIKEKSVCFQQYPNVVSYNHFHKGRPIILGRSEKMAVRYNPNPARITEPLYQVKELEKSPLYTVLCGGKELTVYHTDSFDYVIPVVDDDSPLDFQVNVSKNFQKAVFRPAKTNVQAQISGRELRFQLKKPGKVTLELDDDLKTPLFILCTKRVPKPEKVDHLFESGKVYNVGTLEVKAGETVYLEEGSVVCAA